tara:strand:- start:50 stop:3232 length:3183 start_codon:yes stop_codon:yes gene_type:complete
MVAVPVPKSRPANLMQRETRDQRDRRRAIQNVEQQLKGGRALLGSELTPAGLAERRSEGLDALKGVAVGLPAGLLGLPADLLALLMRDAPQAAAQLASGKSIDELKIEDRTLVDKAVSKFQEYAGAEAIAGYMGFGDELSEDPAEFESSTLGMNPFRQGMLAGEVVADPLLAYKALTKFKGLGPSTRESQALMEVAPRTPDLAPGPVEAPGITMGAPLDLPNELTLPNDLPLADRVDLTNQFEDLRVELARQELDEAEGIDALPIVTLPGRNPGTTGIDGDLQVRDFTPDEDFDIQDVFEFEGDMVHGPTGIRVPAGTMVRGQLNDFISDAAPRATTPADEGIATLPAAEDVIDVEPVVRAAFSPIRQAALSQKPFPITQSMDEFPEGGVSSLGSGYFDADKITEEVIPGSGRQGIATTFNYGNNNLQQINRQGAIADYSPTFQTIDRLEDRGPNGYYSKEELIDILESQPAEAVRDLKGSGFIDYLKSDFAPDTYGSVDELRADFIKRTPQLKVMTVTEGDIQAQAAAKADAEAMNIDFDENKLLPFSENQKLPYSGQQSFFDNDDDLLLDRGAIIINNPNTNIVQDYKLRSSHNYFGSRYSGVPGYIAHSRFSVILDPKNSKRTAIIEEIQGNAVSDAVRNINPSATPLEIARAERLLNNEDYMNSRKARSIYESFEGFRERAAKHQQELIDGDIDNFDNTSLLRGLLPEKPASEVYDIALSVFRKDLEEGAGQFSKDALNETGGYVLIRPDVSEDSLKSALNRHATPEQKQKITDILQENQILKNRFADIGTDEGQDLSATFDDFIGTGDDARGTRHRIFNNLKLKSDAGELTPEGENLFQLIEYGTDLQNDLGPRLVYTGSEADAFLRKLQTRSQEGYQKARTELIDELGPTVFDEMDDAVTSLSDGETMPGQPFATTRDFDEYMPRLILQELVRRGDIEQVIFPSTGSLLSVGGRESFRTGPQAAGFKNTYDKNLKKGLNKLKQDFPEFNYTLETGGRLAALPAYGSDIVVNLQDPAIRAIFENRVIRRAKGGPVDLRPKKMIHSGIGAMAREMM